MTDETSRSAPGNPPDQRHNQDAPAWWAALNRADLPEDEGVGRPRAALQRPARPPRTATLHTAAQPGAPLRRPADRTRSLLLTLLAVVIAALVAWVGIGGGSVRSMVVCLVIFGVPTALAALAATVVIKRGA